jgi:hypothetical protein
MRRTLRARSKRYRSKTRRVQRGGALPIDWIQKASDNPYYQKDFDREDSLREPIPNIPLTNEKIDEVPLSEVAKHLKASVGPIRTAEEFYTIIQNKSQQRDSDFVTITIPWMNSVEEILRYNDTSKKRSVLTPNTYPLLLFSLIVAAPAITDMIPMLEPTEASRPSVPE